MDRVEVHTKCLNSDCLEQCQYFTQCDPLVTLSASTSIGTAGTFNLRKKCKNCGCYEHQHHLQGFMIGTTYVHLSDPPRMQQQPPPPPPLPPPLPSLPTIATSAVPRRVFPVTAQSSSPPFSSSSSDDTTPNRKMTADEASEYAIAEQQQRRNNNEAAIRQDIASLYSFRSNNMDNTTPVAPPIRTRGTGTSNRNVLTQENTSTPPGY